MKRAAFVARISAAAISLLYMVVALPHLPGIEAKDLSSGWFLCGMIIAFAWIPLLILNHRFERGGGLVHAVLSFAPLVCMLAFFGVLFLVIPRIH